METDVKKGIAENGRDIDHHGLTLNVDEAELTASLCLNAQLEDEELDASEVIALLTDNFKLVNIDTRALVDAIQAWNEGERIGENILIAKGTPSIDGRDSVIEWAQKYFDSSAVYDSVDPDSLDHFNIVKIQIVSEGDVVGTIKSPTKGIKGKDVYGHEIHANDGAPPSARIGKNLSVDEKGKEITATVDGQITIHNDIVSVHPVLEISGDVDLDVGKVDFPGTVIVKGNILDGFTVIAGEELRVLGLIEAATVESKGDMFLKGGASGKNKGKIVCGGNFYAKHLDNIDVESEGDLEIKNEAVNCILQTRTVIKCPKGSIIGGEIRANKGGDIGILGSDASILTKLFIGRDFGAEAQIDVMNQEEKDIGEKIKELGEIIKQEEYTLSGRGTQAKDAHKIREAITEKKFNLDELKSRLQECETEKAKLWERVKEAKRDAVLIVRKHIYPGVVVDIGGKRQQWDVEYTRGVKIKLNTKSFEIELIGLI